MNKMLFLSLTLIIPTALQAEELNGQRSPNNPLARPCLYAPQREAYVNEIKDNPKPANCECVFCADINNQIDPKNFVIARFKHNAVFLNLFPYVRGQLLVIPYAHVSELKDLCSEVKQELMEILGALPDIFRKYLGASGVNIGINIGKAAGASQPQHLHIHAMPRMENEIMSYLTLIGNTTPVSWDLHALYDELKPAFDELKDLICPTLIPDIQEYYESGQHNKKVEQVMERAWQNLQYVPVTEHSAIVIDVDETVLSNYEYYKKNNWKKDSEEGVSAWKALQKRPAITPVLTFYKKAVKRGFKIIFISSSSDDLQEAIANNLINEGYTTFERIILRTPEEQKQGFSGKGFSSFKTKRRQQLVDEGYEIVACLGDQWSDLKGDNTGFKVKIPTCFE